MSQRPGKNNAFTANMSRPTSGRDKTADRTAIAVILTILLPPVGLVYLYRSGALRSRGRLVLTILSVVEMTALLVVVLPRRGIVSDTPYPAVPAAVTAAPKGDVVTALDNIDALLAAQQKERAAAEGAEITPEPTDRAAYMAEQQAILNTTVYSVYGRGARYYHSVEICGTQTNRRALTVSEAMNEGMGACPNCSPPVYIG